MRPSGGTIAGRIVVLIFGIVQVLILLRIVLLLLDAREGNDLVSFILNASQIFVAPVRGHPANRRAQRPAARSSTSRQSWPSSAGRSSRRSSWPPSASSGASRPDRRPQPRSSSRSAAAPTRGRRLALSASCGSVIAVQRYDPRTALIVVDVQNDFADPAGGLSVAGGADDRADRQRRDRVGAGRRRLRRLHPGLAPAVDARTSPRTAGSGRSTASPTRGARSSIPTLVGRRPPRPQGRERRGRLFRLHDAGPDDRRDDADRAGGAPPGARASSGSSSAASRPTTA